jgi:hypothetical protein
MVIPQNTLLQQGHKGLVLCKKGKTGGGLKPNVLLKLFGNMIIAGLTK